MNESLSRIPLITKDLSAKREIVLAEKTLDPKVFVLKSIPAFVYGLGLGDRVKILDFDTGDYLLLDRSGQITIRVFVGGGLTRPDVQALIDHVLRLGGVYEVARNDQDSFGASLLLLSMTVDIGFAEIEAMLDIVSGPDVKWEYGNVYDAEGEPLNWWAH